MLSWDPTNNIKKIEMFEKNYLNSQNIGVEKLIYYKNANSCLYYIYKLISIDK